ncbi:uncharacterized protein THITE_127898 [Thermothielavioides terrestris NRRL 8126]|uniref:Uncharacterized protein n=1 Tax=Thermothielavioides terrestris (strain ATCC 38088 / NRRL 8126) TaxID=578455 RepID=G2RI24_THETT|nr:uncharacterized protein THITE_127898 [Thermothielavioides terrestris NRRL 8126]AEO71486.1 hypothetical protein THITE_127898 [Thermothielavioides terrestris NRRL 8126]
MRRPPSKKRDIYETVVCATSPSRAADIRLSNHQSVHHPSSTKQAMCSLPPLSKASPAAKQTPLRHPMVSGIDPS